MLVISLILTTIILMSANFLTYRAPWILTAASFVVGLGCLGVIFPPVLIFSLLLIVLDVATWATGKIDRKRYWSLSCGAQAAAYTLSLLFVWRDVATMQGLHGLFRTESLEERLRVRKAEGSEFLSDATVDRAHQLDRVLFDLPTPRRAYDIRFLKGIHEHQIAYFISSPGFGFTRMRYPTREGVMHGLRGDDPIRQPGSKEILTDDPSFGAKQWALRPDVDRFYAPHWNAVADFVHPEGFGSYEDRAHVSGFQSHRFSKVPQPIDEWTLETVDLVGLVMHEEPVAYVSENLPRMDELRTAATRRLDEFETTGLTALRRGEDVVVATSGPSLRMFGSIRNVEQCSTCHAIARRELLGAFSYRFGRSER